MLNNDEFIAYDFRKPFQTDRKFDLAVSLECAEHIPEENVDIFLDSLVSLSDIILFSAAIPHQRGRGHVNEQYQEYWIEKFIQRGYEYYDAIRRDVWNDKNVRAFYAQNIFIFVNINSQFYNDNKEQIDVCNDFRMINIVHPGIWEDVNNYKVMKLMDSLHKNPLVAWIYYKLIKKHIRFN